MPEDNLSHKQDIVGSIFGRSAKKQVSSLFAPKGPKPALSSAPQRKAPPSVKKIFPAGIDIGASSIKIAQLGLNQDGKVTLTCLINEPLPKEAQADPKERLSKAGPILKKIIEDNDLKKDCFVAAPYSAVKFNLLSLPQMPVSELEKALRWEIKQTAQAEVEDLSFDYITLEKQKFFYNQTGILAITALKKDIFEYLAFFNSINLNPLAIEAESLAGFYALEYAKKISPEETALFLDFGAEKTSLNIISNQELISVRPLNISGNSLTKAVSEYCKVGWDEAEKMKKAFGLSAAAEIQVRNAILPILENMVQDIEHTFKHFSYQVTRSQVTRFDKIILSGGSSRLNALVPFLSERLNVKVEVADVLTIFEPLDIKNIDNLEDLIPRMNVALGLALRGIE